jgi:hypothetical protein
MFCATIPSQSFVKDHCSIRASDKYGRMQISMFRCESGRALEAAKTVQHTEARVTATTIAFSHRHRLVANRNLTWVVIERPFTWMIKCHWQLGYVLSLCEPSTNKSECISLTCIPFDSWIIGTSCTFPHKGFGIFSPQIRMLQCCVLACSNDFYIFRT